MDIIEKYLDVNEYSRPQIYLRKTLGIILHYTGVLKHNHNQIWDYFNTICPRDKHFSSSQFIIGFKGEIIQTMPINEMAYHCGTSKIDPISGKVYTDWARDKFGYFASSKNCSPNQVTLGIEMCSYDENGNFTEETIKSTIDLVSYLLKINKLGINDIGTHNMVVGFKDCPLLWVKKPLLFEAFKNDVLRKL